MADRDTIRDDAAFARFGRRPVEPTVGVRTAGAWTTLVLSTLLAITLTAAGPAAASGLTRSQVHARQWWVQKLSLAKAWAISRGDGVTVAVLDLNVAAGFDGSPSDLDGVFVPGFSVGGPASGLTADERDHGSIMASEIAGRGTGFGVRGVAPLARVMPVQLGDLTNASTATALNRLAAMSHPPDVVSMSYGAPGACPDDLQNAVRAATSRNIVLLASAGNDGQAGNTAQAPADCAGVLAIGAVSDDDDATPWDGSTRQSYVALGAPGVQIVCYDGQVPSHAANDTGTSDATAIAAGSFAVVRGKYRTLSGRDLVTRMIYTAKQFQGAQGSRNTATGFGVALPYYGLTQSVPADAPNPIYDALDATTPTTSSAPTSSGPPSSASSTSQSTSPPSSAAVSSSAGPAATGASDDGSSRGVIVGVMIAVLVVGAVTVLLLVRRRRPVAPGPYGPPPSGWPGPPPWSSPPPGPPPWGPPPPGPPPGDRW